MENKQENQRNIPFGQDWFIEAAELLYKVTEKDKEGWCLGVTGAALICIYGSGFGLLKMSHDPTSMKYNELSTLLKHRDGCIQYENKIFYLDQKEKKLTELSEENQKLQSILNNLPNDELYMATPEELEIIGSSIGHSISKLQLFHDVFQDALKRLAEYSSETIKTKYSSKLENEQRMTKMTNLVKKMEEDYPVRAFVETIMLITNPRQKALDMLAQQSEPLSKLPQQILRDDLFKSNYYISPLLALLEPNAELREIDEVAPIGLYSYEDLVEFFNSCAKSLTSESESLNYPVSLVLRSYKHAVLVSIDPNQKKQIVIQPNDLDKQEALLENIPSCLTEEFEVKQDRRIALDIRMYTHVNDFEFTKKHLLNWKKSDQFKELHQRGYQIDKERDFCFLMAALMRGDDSARAIDDLLKLGFDPNLPISKNSITQLLTESFFFNFEEISPLEFVIKIKKYDCVKSLLHSTHIKIDDRLLFEAISKENIELVTVLVESNKFDLNSIEIHGGDSTTVLMKAVSSGNLELIQYLIQHGADVNYCDLSMQDTVLSYALSRGSPVNVVSLLLEHGAKVYNDSIIANLPDSEFKYEISALLSGKGQALSFDNEVKIKHQADRKNLGLELIFRMHMNSLLTKRENALASTHYLNEKSIYGAIYSARRFEDVSVNYTFEKFESDNFFEDEEEYSTKFKEFKDNIYGTRNGYLDKIVGFLMQDETRLDQFKNRKGLLFDKEIVTDAMYKDLTQKLLIANRQDTYDFFAEKSGDQGHSTDILPRKKDNKFI